MTNDTVEKRQKGKLKEKMKKKMKKKNRFISLYTKLGQPWVSHECLTLTFIKFTFREERSWETTYLHGCSSSKIFQIYPWYFSPTWEIKHVCTSVTKEEGQAFKHYYEH